MASISDMISAFSLAVSLATASFTTYQWFDAEKESKIAASIDISRKYLEDNSITNNIRLLAQSPDLDKHEYDEFLSRLNYIAYLSNSNMIDKRYLSLQIGCDMELVYNIIAPKAMKAGFLPVNVSELKKYITDANTCSGEGR